MRVLATVAAPKRAASEWMKPSRWRVFIFTLILLARPVQVSSFEVRTCGSLDIRNHPSMFFRQITTRETEIKYSNCTVLEGTFSLSMVVNSTVTEDDFPVFPSIVEITGYVLIFNVRSLTTLSRMFPSLRVIGGQQLIMNYALVIYQNADLKEIGLPSLRIIRNGGVRITENPSLCYTKNIDWASFLYGPINDVLIADGSNSGQQCSDECDVPAEVRCHEVQGATSCWNSTHCQELCPFDAARPSSLSSSVREPGPGCAVSSPHEECHEECLAGCEQPGDAEACFACRKFRHSGLCIPACPAHLYSYLGRCITKEDCLIIRDSRPQSDGPKKFHKPVLGKCDLDCPVGYEEYSDNINEEVRACRKCEGDCPKRCSGKAVDTESIAYELAGCDIIEGSLEIELRLSSDFRVEKLATAFGSIKKITGYLLVRFSPSLISLSMFKNLAEIQGRELYQNRYAVAIYENQNLRQLFPHRNITISNGTVQVHNNRMLCYQRVVDMMRSIGLLPKMSEEDQSSFSNGDKAICDESTFNITSVQPLPTGFHLSWQAFNTSDIDHRKFLGYQIFFKRVHTSNVQEVSIDEDRSACADTWMMHFEPVKSENPPPRSGEAPLLLPGDENSTETERDRHREKQSAIADTMIAHDGIAADAYYAIYVQTRMVNHPGARNAISRVVIAKTQFNHPTSPRIKSFEAGANSITLEWEPPDLPNGNVTHYIVTWQAQRRDMTYNIKHVCDTGRAYLRGAPVTSRQVQDAASGASPAPSAASLLIGGGAQGTCSAQPGCCECSAVQSSRGSGSPEESLSAVEQKDAFENAVQNVVFVQSCEHRFEPVRCAQWAVWREERERAAGQSTTEATPTRHGRRERRRRRGHAIDEKDKKKKKKNANKNSNKNRQIRSLAAKENDKDLANEVPVDEDEEEEVGATLTVQSFSSDLADADSAFHANIEMPEQPGYLLRVDSAPAEVSSRNVSGQSIVIDGLRHFTEYQISLIACQDSTVDPSYCSQRPVYYTIRTRPITDKDIVDAATIETSTVNGSNSALITFKPPEDPNDQLLGFRVSVINEDRPATPIEQCVSLADFAGGVLLTGLADGTYRVEVRTVTLIGLSEAAVGAQTIFMNTPGFFTPLRIVLLLLFFLIILLTAGLITWFGFRRYYAKTVGEYIRQTISANPEYLSQFDVYKQDDWELPRNKLTLQHEIGRGTFGKVFQGQGHDLESKCGVRFGLCAIKTVSEDANPAERLHFLIEASVMKQFNTPYIVKLFGVVSDGQPVLVVMEMMAKGNLRDYLRSRRPDGEENTEGEPVPTEEEYLEWAAQIADGMAYLEYHKFCHRDLAARNCMVAGNKSVKIGDFGMARDIYYHEYYKPTGKRLMPVRWMAPESLKDGKFSLKSDVWSFGIVLYEMLTLAQQPYQGLANDQVFNYIGVSRRILERPTDCPDFWYGLMEACWKYSPKDRPTFADIVHLLAESTSQHFRDTSFILNDGKDAGEGIPFGPIQGAGDECPYVPEPIGDRSDEVIDEEGAICIQNRKPGPGCNGSPPSGAGWEELGHEDGYALRDAEAEL